MGDAGKPWWADNGELKEFFRQSYEEFERELEACAPRRPAVEDPVMAEIMSGACRRALAVARDELEHARGAYDDAVRAARTAGYSWGEIGRILGVSKQVLHRRFRYTTQGEPDR